MSIVRIAGLADLAWLAATPALADDAQFCSVPAYLLSTDSTLPKVEAAFKARAPLRVLVIGSRSSAMSGPDGAASSYPARFEAALRSILPGSDISVSTDLHPRETAADVAAKIEKIMLERKPTLVVWQTGTVDAMRSIDPDDFRAALDTGLAALQKADADVILMNLQYSPRMETILAATNYNDTLRVVAQEHGVPLFDRFAQAHSIGVAARVHDCIGRALSKLVIEAAHINPNELEVR